MLKPPIEPMLAKLTNAIPKGEQWMYEPKWDGFRALVFKDGDELSIQSRELKSLNRYFVELEEPLKQQLPERCVLDGEIVIARNGRLDFEALLLRIHPAKSRVSMLAKELPASYIAWDLLWIGDEDLRNKGQAERRTRLEEALASVKSPVYVTPATRDIAVAEDWFSRFEGAGLDGVIAKQESQVYAAGKRVMTKVKHARTVDCVVAGFRWYKGGQGTLVGSLLLGLYDSEKKLQHVGICASFTRQRRAELLKELEPFREGARTAHPWSEWATFVEENAGRRIPGASSRWNRGKDLSWEPLRIALVCEVAFDHLQGTRFRHATHFQRWRTDRSPESCTYEQLDVVPAVELQRIFAP